MAFSQAQAQTQTLFLGLSQAQVKLKLLIFPNKLSLNMHYLTKLDLFTALLPIAKQLKTPLQALILA